MNENIQINFSDKWVPVNSKNPSSNGTYIVTVTNNTNKRVIAFAVYTTDNGWTLLANKGDSAQWKIIAYIPDINDMIMPYSGTIQTFAVGDIITWTHPQYKDKICWMLISSFDYASDNAARATIGRNWYGDEGLVYTNWVPDFFGNDCHLATVEERKKIYIDMFVHFKKDYIIGKGTFTERNIGYETMLITMQKHPVILQILKDMWEEYDDKKEMQTNTNNDCEN